MRSIRVPCMQRISRGGPHRLHVLSWIVLSHCALLLSLVPTKADASVVLPVTLDQLVAGSGEVFAGTVAAVDYEPEAHFGVVTRVTFAELDQVKTRVARRTLTLSIRGGRRGNVSSWIEGLPQFKVGTRYVVFADSDTGSMANSYSPINGLWQGVFVVQRGASGAQEILDIGGRAVVAVVGGRPVLVELDQVSRATKFSGVGRPLPPRPASSDPNRPKPGGRVVRAFERSPSDTLGTDSLSKLAGQFGARRASGTAYLVPKSLDPGRRSSEAEFLSALRRLQQERR